MHLSPNSPLTLVYGVGCRAFPSSQFYFHSKEASLRTLLDVRLRRDLTWCFDHHYYLTDTLSSVNTSTADRGMQPSQRQPTCEDLDISFNSSLISARTCTPHLGNCIVRRSNCPANDPSSRPDLSKPPTNTAPMGQALISTNAGRAMLSLPSSLHIIPHSRPCSIFPQGCPEAGSSLPLPVGFRLSFSRALLTPSET